MNKHRQFLERHNLERHIAAYANMSQGILTPLYKTHIHMVLNMYYLHYT